MASSDALPKFETLGKINRIFIHWRLSVFLCLAVILGGTSLPIFNYKIPLYYSSLLFLGHAWFNRTRPISNIWCTPFILGFVFFLFHCLFLIPLPPAIWRRLSGRDLVVDGYNFLEMDIPWLPLSLHPEFTLTSLFNFLPLITVAVIFYISFNKKELKRAEMMIVLMTLLTIIYGWISIFSGVSVFGAYEAFGKGLPSGAFTNVNHQSTLVALTMPLAILGIYKAKEETRKYNGGNKYYYLGALVLLISGLITGKSMAGYIFLLLLIPFVFSIILETVSYMRVSILSILVLGGLIMIDMLLLDNHFQSLLTQLSTDFKNSRLKIITTTLEAREEFGLLGTGPGTFPIIYRMFEDASTINTVYINAAHNDFLQIWLEFGIFGILWMIVAGTCLLKKIGLALMGPLSQRKDVVIYGLCVLVPISHSLVDYPLRTMTICTLWFFLVLRLNSVVEGSKFKN